MGLIESIMNKFGWSKKSKGGTLVDFLDGNGAFYTQFGDSIYASDVVQQAINSIVSEMKKLTPKHMIVKNGQDPVLVDDNVQRVLENPNELMTSSYYIEKMVWNYFLNNNAFAYPYWVNGKLESITPLQPTNVEFWMTPDNKMWVTMKFKNGYVADLPYSNLIHIRRNYSVSDVMGGNEKGQPDDKALLEVLKLNDKLLKGLAKQLDMQMSVQGIIKMKGTVGKDDQFQAVEEFERKIAQHQTAFLPSDFNTDIQMISKNMQLLNKDVLEFLDKKILRMYGTSLPIVTGEYTVEQFNAFYQKAIEPLANDFNQTHTKAIFSNKETFGFGHKIVFSSNELIHMNVTQKLEYYKMLIDIGGCYKNEVRVAFGDYPLKELEGQIALSSNQQNALNNKTTGTEPVATGVVEDVVEETQEIIKKPLLIGQIQALQAIVASYQAGSYTYAQAKNMLMIGVGLSAEEAEKVLDYQDEVNDGGAANE